LMSPAIEGRKHRAAQDFDVLRWYESKPPEEQVAIGSMNLDRDQAIRLMTAETIANGFLDPNSNVRFEYQDPRTFEATHGAQRAVAFVQSDTPTIVFNTGKMKTGTAYHELFHQLSRSPQIVDYGALTTKLLGVTDASGNIVQPGLLGKADVSRLGDVYFSRLDPIGQKSIEAEKAAYDANPDSPEGAAWTKRIVNEIGAELFANLARDTKGSLLEAIDKPTLALVDSMTRADRSQWVQNWGARLQKVLGAVPTAESDIFPGLKASPEIQAMLRDFVRAKRKLTKTPEFNEDNAEVHVVVNPRDAFRPGGDEIVKKFPDNDNFAKDAAGQPVYAGGRPVLLTESEIKKVQTNRAQAMSKALEAIPDTGEAGVMRPTAPVSVAPAPTPALPPGAIAATPKATRPVTKGTSSFTGKNFSDAQIAALEKLPDSVLTPSMKAKLKTLNDLAKRGDGSPILLFYNAALKNRRYSSAIRETARVISPIAMSITKAGNFTVTGLDITAFNSKLQRWFADKPRAFDDFNNSPDFFIEKTQQYLESHKAGQPGATGLDADAAKALRMRNRIQDFLNIRDIASEPLNPDRLSKASDKDGLIRAFRFDRMNRVEPARGDKFPIDYEMVKRNYSPQGEKDANEELRKLRGHLQAIDVAPVTDPTLKGMQDEMRQRASQATGKAAQQVTQESGQYSQLERVIDQKVQGESIPAAQLAAMLRNPQSGVKADEMKWTGLDDYLKGKGRVTKQELLDFVRSNRLQIEEKRLGEDRQTPVMAEWTDFGNGDAVLFARGGTGERLASIKIEDDGKAVAKIHTEWGGMQAFDSVREAKNWVDSLPAIQKIRAGSPVIPTKYDQYKSPGGENYREILFRLPDKEQVKDGPTDHWQDSRVFAHARVQDFDGGKTLLVDELQSDWHQRGRKEGYREDLATTTAKVEALRLKAGAEAEKLNEMGAQVDSALREILNGNENHVFHLRSDLERAAQSRLDRRWAEFLDVNQNLIAPIRGQLDAYRAQVLRANEAYSALQQARNVEYRQENQPPPAPFSKTWHEFMVKRILRDAVEKGYKAIEWPDGETIAKRFNLNQHMSELHYVADVSKSESGWTIYPDGDYGNAMFIPDSALADHVGEGVAERMRKGEGEEIRDASGYKTRALKGEMQLDSGESRGMKTFYDDILPSFINKYAKKWGAKVVDTARGSGITPEWDHTSSWQHIFRKGKEKLAEVARTGTDRWTVYNKDSISIGNYPTLEEAKSATESAFASDRAKLKELDAQIQQVEQEMEQAQQRPLSAALRMRRLQDQHNALRTERHQLLMSEGFPVHRLEITDAMRQDIKTKGQPLFSPDVTAEQVRDLPADKFATESKTWKGGLTGQAIQLGKTLKPEDLSKLQTMLDESRAKAKQIRQSGDLQGAMVEALRGQFFREAAEAYRASQGEEGLSIRPEDVNKLKRHQLVSNQKRKLLTIRGTLIV
jgi:hypothetical protein